MMNLRINDYQKVQGSEEPCIVGVDDSSDQWGDPGDCLDPPSDVEEGWRP